MTAAAPLFKKADGIDLDVRGPDGAIYSIHGAVEAGFEGVARAFVANFAAGEETGAACSAVVGGQTVVDLWGGWQDAAHRRPWERDTIVNMMSVAKAFTTVAAAILVERGDLDLDAPVARYWPEFAANGKAGIKVRWLLDHRAGLPVIRPSLPRGAIYDWEAITGALARMAPLWEPGTFSGYHILTMGFLVGELIRRIGGEMPGAFVRREVCETLGIDYQIGLNDDEIARTADFIPATGGTIFAVEDLPDDEPLKYAWMELPREEDFNSHAWRTATIPGANGHGNARAVARLFGCLAAEGEIDGVRLLKPETIRIFTAEQHNLREVVMKRSYHQALGMLRNSPPIVQMGPNPGAFGHHGVGGSIGLADPAIGLGFSYSANRMHARVDNGPRAGRLKDAVFRAVYLPFEHERGEAAA
jgi:CubicO group peptidase (beta-lactamase class C family)